MNEMCLSTFDYKRQGLYEELKHYHSATKKLINAESKIFRDSD